MGELNFLSVVDMADLVRRGRVSSRQLIEAHIRQICSHNPKLNAVVTLDEEGALKRAREADEALAHGQIWGPLHGVPFTIKDVFATAGLRTTSGSPRLANYVPPEDATVVARLRSAGAILLGKTNTPQFAADNQTNNPLFGRTNNPWDVSRTPGGSSGGAAAVVAAGLSPLDIGGDLGGSIRRPAHYCGVYGLKPTDFLVPHTGHIPPPPGVTSWAMLRYLFSAGPLARSVADLRLALTLIAGADGVHSEVPPLPLIETAPRSLRGLRIAWSDDFSGLPLCQESRTALENFARELELAGCHVERCSPPGLDFQQALRTDGEIEQAAFFASSRLPRFLLRWIASRLYRRDPLASGYLYGAGATLGRFAAALAKRDGFIYQLESFLSGWDAWLVPVTATPAFPHMQTRNPIEQIRAAIEVDGQRISYYAATSGHLNVFNLTGSPAVVIPVTRSKEGLPIGVQIVGRRWRDLDLLSVAEALTEVTGPFIAPQGYQ